LERWLTEIVQACEELNVPKPDSGNWTLVHRGFQFEPRPLWRNSSRAVCSHPSEVRVVSGISGAIQSATCVQGGGPETHSDVRSSAASKWSARTRGVLVSAVRLKGRAQHSHESCDTD